LKDADVVRHRYAETEYQFCCRGCLEVFTRNPEKYIEEIRDVIVCPSCLAEKPLALAVSCEHEGTTVHFCRCPHCLDAFRKEPDRLLRRLKGLENSGSRAAAPAGGCDA
jgi:YHS domain-containing protein